MPTKHRPRTPFYRGLAILLSGAIILPMTVNSPVASQEYSQTASAVSARFQPDYASLADNFIKGLAGKSPELLAKYTKLRGVLQKTGALARMGGYLAEGDWAGAMTEAQGVAKDEALGAIPVIGQFYAMSQVGAELGNWATDHFGSGRFDSLYAAAMQLDENDWQQGTTSGFVQQVLTEGTKGGVLYTWLNQQTGVQRTRAENDQLIWKMLKSKRDFETLCDRYGLAGEHRNFETLKLRISADMRIRAKEAEKLEQDRLEGLRLAFAQKIAQEKEALEQKRAAEAENTAFHCNVWLGRATDPTGEVSIDRRPSAEDIEYLCGEKPEDTQVADTPQTQDTDTAEPNEPPAPFSPSEPEATADPAIAIGVTRQIVGHQTFCTVSVMNTTAFPIEGFNLSVNAAGGFSSGGFGMGQSAQGATTLAPQEIRSFTTYAGGDVAGVVGSISGAGRTLGSFRCDSAHERPALAEVIVADGTYQGFMQGDFTHGALRLTITGTGFTGSIGGAYDGAYDVGSITGQVSGSFDPETGALTGSLAGTAISSKDGDTIGFAGTITGTFADGALTGEFEGSGGYNFDSGAWTASR